MKKTLLAFLIILILGYLIPQRFSMPVQGATRSSYDQHSFWAYPWGKSVTHKGVDIFAKEGTPVLAATGGLVVYTGQIERGGNVVLILGPKWRLHYYAHLSEIRTSGFSWASRGQVVGSVGATGNAKGKPPHLHYSIKTFIPYFWQADKGHQGWEKMFYLNPINFLNTVG